MNWILVNNLIKKFDNKKEFKKYLIDTVDIYSNSYNGINLILFIIIK